ncbi:uncharacterized protein LOC142344713 isoform X2 [Convolutriloba macropyga]|uniref:uncharacterized protein LOC142344713 isoform X2 n=1 Tax=Convolutriloba macropyga TaxID=536237 RepID=UPI003F526337
MNRNIRNPTRNSNNQIDRRDERRRRNEAGGHAPPSASQWQHHHQQQGSAPLYSGQGESNYNNQQPYHPYQGITPLDYSYSVSQGTASAETQDNYEYNEDSNLLEEEEWEGEEEEEDEGDDDNYDTETAGIEMDQDLVIGVKYKDGQTKSWSVQTSSGEGSDQNQKGKQANKNKQFRTTIETETDVVLENPFKEDSRIADIRNRRRVTPNEFIGQLGSTSLPRGNARPYPNLVPSQSRNQEHNNLDVGMYNNIRRGDEKWRLGVTPLSEQSENTTGTSDFSPNYSGTFSQQGDAGVKGGSRTPGGGGGACPCDDGGYDDDDVGDNEDNYDNLGHSRTPGVENQQGVCNCDEDDDEDDDDGYGEYDKLGDQMAGYLHDQLSSDQSGGGDLSSGDFDFFASGSGTTCDNILSQTMGQMSAVGEIPDQDTLKVEPVHSNYQRSTPTLQKDQVVSEPTVVVPPPEQDQSLHPDDHLSGANSPLQDLETRNPESYFTAEMALDNPSTSDEYQDADQEFRDNDATTAGDRGVIPVEPVNAPSQYAKRTDIYMETGFEPATLSWPPTTRSDEDSSPDRPNRQPTIESAKSPTFDENSASSRYTYTNSQEITVIGRRESEYSFRHSKGPMSQESHDVIQTPPDRSNQLPSFQSVSKIGTPSHSMSSASNMQRLGRDGQPVRSQSRSSAGSKSPPSPSHPHRPSYFSVDSRNPNDTLLRSMDKTGKTADEELYATAESIKFPTAVSKDVVDSRGQPSDAGSMSYQSFKSVVKAKEGNLSDSRDDETIYSDDDGEFEDTGGSGFGALQEEDKDKMPSAGRPGDEQASESSSFMTIGEEESQKGISSGSDLDYDDPDVCQSELIENENTDEFTVKGQRLIQYENDENDDEKLSQYQTTENKYTPRSDGGYEVEPVSRPYEQVFHGPIDEIEEIWTLAEVEDENDSSIHGEDLGPPYLTAAGQKVAIEKSSDDSHPVVDSKSFTRTNYPSDMQITSLDSVVGPGDKKDERGPSRSIEVAPTPPKVPKMPVMDNSPHFVSYDSPFGTDDEVKFSRSPRKSSVSTGQKPTDAIYEMEEMRSDEDLITEVTTKTSFTRETVIERIKDKPEEGVEPFPEEIEGDQSKSKTADLANKTKPTPEHETPADLADLQTPRDPGSGKVSEDGPHSTPRKTSQDGQRHSSVDFQKDFPFTFMTMDDMPAYPEVLKANRKIKTTKHLKILERITFHEDIKIDSCYLGGDAQLLRNYVLGFIGHTSLKEALMSKGAGDISSLVPYIDKETLNNQLVSVLQRAEKLAKNFDRHVKNYERTMQRLSSSDLPDSKSWNQNSKSSSRYSYPKKPKPKLSSRGSVTKLQTKPPSVSARPMQTSLRLPGKRSIPRQGYGRAPAPYNKGSTYAQRANLRSRRSNNGSIHSRKTSSTHRDRSNRGMHSRKTTSRLSVKGTDQSVDYDTPAGVSVDLSITSGTQRDPSHSPVFLKIKKDEAAANLESIQYVKKQYAAGKFQKSFMSPRSYMSEKISENTSLHAVSESFSLSPRRHNSDANDAQLKFDAFKYFIRALFSRLYGPNAKVTQNKLRKLWRAKQSKMSKTETSGQHSKKSTKQIIEQLLQIQIHDDIYNVFWESMGLSDNDLLSLTAYLEKARDWGMILAEDDQYRHFVSALIKHLRSNQFYENQQIFSSQQITLDEVTEFLSRLAGVLVSPAQVKQFLDSVDYNSEGPYSQESIIESIACKFQNILEKSSKSGIFDAQNAFQSQQSRHPQAAVS